MKQVFYYIHGYMNKSAHGIHIEKINSSTVQTTKASVTKYRVDSKELIFQYGFDNTNPDIHSVIYRCVGKASSNKKQTFYSDRVNRHLHEYVKSNDHFYFGIMLDATAFDTNDLVRHIDQFVRKANSVILRKGMPLCVFSMSKVFYAMAPILHDTYTKLVNARTILSDLSSDLPALLDNYTTKVEPYLDLLSDKENAVNIYLGIDYKEVKSTAIRNIISPNVLYEDYAACIQAFTKSFVFTQYLFLAGSRVNGDALFIDLSTATTLSEATRVLQVLEKQLSDYIKHIEYFLRRHKLIKTDTLCS